MVEMDKITQLKIYTNGKIIEDLHFFTFEGILNNALKVYGYIKIQGLK